MADLKEELRFLARPVSPGLSDGRSLELVSSGEGKMLDLPCRLFLSYDEEGKLRFRGESGFWIDLRERGGRIEGKVGVSSSRGNEEDLLLFDVGEARIRTVGELSENSPFRVLAEAFWLGTDPLKELYGLGEGAEKLELKGEGVEWKVGDLFVFSSGRWEKGKEGEGPMARFRVRGERLAEWECWEGGSYFRLPVQMAPLMGLRVKGEEFLSSIRIRSEKQVSLVLDKQPMVLRLGDWVLKQNGRWRVIRRADERKKIVEGKGGDLFILDKIEGKTVRGHLFLGSRSQALPIEATAGETAMRQPPTAPVLRPLKLRNGRGG
jgi:hypothetical protein